MDGVLRMEAAVERSTITSKPGVETLARTAISLAVRIPTKKIIHSELMTITASPGDAVGNILR
jgi:hypothetical protein